MIEIRGDLVAQFTTMLQGTVGAFALTLAAVIGVFVAFAIARQLIFTLKNATSGRGGR